MQWHHSNASDLIVRSERFILRFNHDKAPLNDELVKIAMRIIKFASVLQDIYNDSYILVLKTQVLKIEFQD